MQPRVVDDDLVRLHIKHDEGRYDSQPFNFVHREYLVALGVAREVEASGGRLVFGVYADESSQGGTRWELEEESVPEDGDEETPFVLDERGLATYKPPAGHTDAFVLECAEGPPPA